MTLMHQRADTDAPSFEFLMQAIGQSVDLWNRTWNESGEIYSGTSEGYHSAMEFLIQTFSSIEEEFEEYKKEIADVAPLLGPMVSELIDLIYVSAQRLSLIDRGVAWDEVKLVLEKNAAKTKETHHLCFDEKIRRIGHEDCKCTS